jgi:fatty acid desaturase
VRRSDLRGLLQLGGHVLALAAAEWWLLHASGPARVVATFVTGVVLVFLFCAEHECAHRTAFRHRSLADGTAVAIGALLLVPSRWFRFFHAAHHRWTQEPGLDPELDGAPPATRTGRLFHLTAVRYWWSMGAVVVRLARGDADQRWIPRGHRRAVVREARVVAMLYAAVIVVSIATRSMLAIDAWALPALAGQPFLRAFLLAEHTGCPLGAGPVAGTRTTRTNALVRWLSWNMPYHAEHHAHPQVPFHQLPALHAMGDAHGAVLARGYARTVIQLLSGAPRTIRTAAAPRA